MEIKINPKYQIGQTVYYWNRFLKKSKDNFREIVIIGFTIIHRKNYTNIFYDSIYYREISETEIISQEEYNKI